MARGALRNIAKLLNNIQEDIPVADQFLHDLIKSIEKTDANNHRKPSQTYKPSGMNCMRMSYYQITGIEPEAENGGYSLIGIGESGTDRHIRIQQAIEYMKNNGYECEYIDVETFIKQRKLTDLQVVEKSGMETKIFNKKLNMSFLTDGIIKYKNKYYIFEFKTEISNKWFSRIFVDEKHYKQATAYSINFGIDDVVFVYENRDTCQKKAYLLTVTGKMKQELLAYIYSCDEYIANKQVPPKCSEAKYCQYCQYKEKCRKDGD